MSGKLVDRYFVITRKMLRAKMRREHGKKGFAVAWARYQDVNRGKPKTQTYIQRMKAKTAVAKVKGA